jgi:hypothetical protein
MAAIPFAAISIHPAGNSHINEDMEIKSKSTVMQNACTNSTTNIITVVLKLYPFLTTFLQIERVTIENQLGALGIKQFHLGRFASEAKKLPLQLLAETFDIIGTSSSVYLLLLQFSSHSLFGRLPGKLINQDNITFVFLLLVAGNFKHAIT